MILFRIDEGIASLIDCVDDGIHHCIWVLLLRDTCLLHGQGIHFLKRTSRHLLHVGQVTNNLTFSVERRAPVCSVEMREGRRHIFGGLVKASFGIEKIISSFPHTSELPDRVGVDTEPVAKPISLDSASNVADIHGSVFMR